MGHRVPFLIDSKGENAGVLPARWLIAIALLGCAAAPVVPVTGATPSSLPSVTVATLRGEPVEVRRVAGGRVALVSLWATWCEACQKEMDALNRLDAKAGADAIVIGIAVGEEREKIATFTQQRGLRYVQLVDSDFAFADAIGQRRLPATIVVNRQGQIVYRGDALDGAGLDALRKAIAGTL
jgi:thiol-disulfide isomerase/thioredoxin